MADINETLNFVMAARHDVAMALNTTPKECKRKLQDLHHDLGILMARLQQMAADAHAGEGEATE